MRRRAFLAVLLVLCGCGPGEAPKKDASASVSATSVEKAAAKPQPPGEAAANIPRVAMLLYGAKGVFPLSPSAPPLLFRDRLRELGYVEGKTILLDESYADGDPQRLTQLARAIVASKPDVIVAIAAAATGAAREATSTIPIVMAHAGNPVGSGLVASLARPGGNVTGTTSMIPELGVKQVELLRELMPRLAKLGVLVNPTNAGTPPYLANVNEAARRANVSVVVAEVSRSEDFDKAFGSLRDARPDAMLVMNEPLIGLHRDRILEFTRTNQLPASYDVGREFVRLGGLMSYGPVLTNHYAIAAEYVDKILKGANPGDLPVQQPTQFALVVNLKTAKALGLTLPQSLLLLADELIE